MWDPLQETLVRVGGGHPFLKHASYSAEDNVLFIFISI